jgi:hypothetical protein
LFQALQAGLFDRRNLLAQHRQPRQGAAEFVEAIRWDWQIFGRSQSAQPLRRLAQFWLEAADAEPRQGAFHLVDDTRALSNKTFTFAVRAFGVFLLRGWNRDHPAMPTFAT